MVIKIEANVKRKGKNIGAPVFSGTDAEIVRIRPTKLRKCVDFRVKIC